MNLKALKEELNSVKDAKKALLNNAITEVRSLEDSENEELRQLNDKIEELKSQIEKAEAELRSNSVEEIIENNNSLGINSSWNFVIAIYIPGSKILIKQAINLIIFKKFPNL